MENMKWEKINARNLLFRLAWRIHWRAGLEGKKGVGESPAVPTGTISSMPAQT